MNPFFNMMRPMMQQNPMMQVIQQYRQIKNNPEQLATFLKQKGMITDDQCTDISKMGGHYSQVGQYLMNNGKMPTNVQQYENQVSQVQNMMNQQNNQ